MKLFRVDKDAKFIQYAERDFKKENQEEVLEFWLEHNPAHILEDENVLIIGRQVPTNLGSIIDLLGIDREGNVVVIELKRDRTPRETIAQILEYASFENAQSEQKWLIKNDVDADKKERFFAIISSIVEK